MQRENHMAFVQAWKAVHGTSSGVGRQPEGCRWEGLRLHNLPDCCPETAAIQHTPAGNPELPVRGAREKHCATRGSSPYPPPPPPVGSMPGEAALHFVF